MPISWTSEKISERTEKEIAIIRENAVRLKAAEIVLMCDSELESRASRKKTKAKKKPIENDSTRTAIGYHFVCRPQGNGVVVNDDGTVWSGTWVVAESQAEKSLRAGAYVALHLSHAEPSYLKGQILGFRRSPRAKRYAEGQEVKTREGTDFLLSLSEDQIQWSGEGTVEKSYVYTPIQNNN
ncbi:MAG TPA: hypothetical protein VGE73_10795 [Pseudolabrys sp.]